MVDLLKAKSKELKPYFEKDRHLCPFYGFHLTLAGFNSMIDQEGNQCALIRNHYSPCQMERQEKTPDWKDCHFNNEKNRGDLAIILNEIKVFPKEFCPPKAKSWKGILLRDWVKYMANHGN